ncbi:Erg28-like protein [Fomitiporia mediterranea MF3/22]|uniref:Erg28-like protein n=1 Tax=Fomitiporia mediterranea (strain MF3/22) TaxID=694068 RepID=UPI000440817C|nr:Erg28-like protein [Fomitiporia mediterranea MF3/22]EJD06875.1 Erg28-like protein [Fomitiporia mediterranea MF3/22]
MPFLDLLPQTPGLLPKWQLFVSTVALYNTVQCFCTSKLTRRVYNNAPVVTDLQVRTFGVWTITSAVVRFYAAYHITEKAVYDLALFTYLIAFGHFSSELLIFRTAKINPGIMSTFVFASLSLVWMLVQYDYYVGPPAYTP